MTVKYEAMVDAEATLQTSESHQAIVENDLSTKTIEFLRARLLSERAASKAAREQVQQISEQVRELQARLQTEIEQRKEAETAMGKVFMILKAKGLTADAAALASLEVKDQLESSMPISDDIKETLKNPMCDKKEGASCPKENAAIVKVVPPDQRNETSEKNSVEHGTHGRNEDNASNGIIHEGIPNVGNGMDQSQGKDEIKHAVPIGLSGKTDENRLKRAPDCEEDVEVIDQGLAITLKLKAMLHQIEEEVHALPEEEQLKFELQGWVDHVASVLNKGKDLSLRGSPIDVNKTDSNQATEGLETKHTKRFVSQGSKETAVALTVATGIPSIDQALKKGINTTPAPDISLSIVPKDELLQRNLHQSSNSLDDSCYSTGYPYRDPVQHATMLHNRKPPCDYLKGSSSVPFSFQNAPKVPRHQQMYSSSHAMSAHRQTMHSHYYADAESPYFVEALSSKNSDAFSIEDGAFDQAWSHQARISSLQRQAGFGQEMIGGPYFVDDLAVNNTSPDVYRKESNLFVHGNINYERSPAYHRSMSQGRDSMEAKVKSSRHPRGPVNDATLSLMDDKNGRLGDILMALDAARQRVNDGDQSFQQLFGPTAADAKLYKGYQYEDEMQQLPYGYYHWPRVTSQTPVIHFPPSPTSEYGFSAFERHARHRRSSSVSTNFMMPGWESSPHHRGEVHLGNGITLYTD